MTYEIIAFPNGVRTVAASLHGMTAGFERLTEFAAIKAGLTNAGSEADGIVAHAQTIAKVNGEYVDVERDGVVIATVGPEGII